MSLRDPRRGVLLVLEEGPMTTEALEKRVRGARELLPILETQGLVVRHGELWRIL